MEIPEDQIGNATETIRKDSTPAGGNPGALENLNNFIKDSREIDFS